MAMQERGRITYSGMGGFLNPPTHPEHGLSVETDLRRRKENRGGMSLSAAVDCEWLDGATRAAARHALAGWERPPIDRDDVQDWIALVLGYFRNCYRGAGTEPECWHAGNLYIGDPKGAIPEPTVDDHAGVHLIRKYYPEYTPTDADFARAYWGTKPAEVS